MDAYVEKMEAQLKVWRAKLDEMLGKAQKAGAQGKIEGQKHYENLREKLDELKASGSAKWEVLKDGIEKAKDDLVASFHEAKNKKAG